MPWIKNVSPFGELDVPLLRRTVAAGEVIEVTAEQAGHPPSEFRPVTDDELPGLIADGLLHLTRVNDDGSRDLYDPGEGLLAQTSNWAPAKAPKAAATTVTDTPSEG
jgi:hypothetical protein